ncbi:MAG: glutamyl-tRNA reductase [Actinomycetota bacterium]|nr:glutamyl-tRNA reductase [Actinomycetota bacterium]
MTVVALGLNYRSAPPSVLGDVALAADVIPKALVEILDSPFINEAVVLSTCNRIEVYVDAERFHEGYQAVRDALSLVSGVGVDDFVEHLYVHYHDEAVQHLFEVAAGLDSVVLGEHEILGQVRLAFESARAGGATGPVLNALFQHALSTGKRVRSDTSIGEHTASLSHAAVELVLERTPSLHGQRVVLVGAGEVGSSVATALVKVAADTDAVLDLIIVNRTPEKALALAHELGGRPGSIDQLARLVAEADVVVSATASGVALIGVEHLGDGPTLLLDLAMPGDIDPAVGEDPRASLLDLSSLQTLANRGIERRQAEVPAVRVVIADGLDRYRNAVRAREVEPLLGSLHRWADGVRSVELDRYRNRLGQLDVTQLEAVEALTRAVVAKLLHAPSAELRTAAGTPRGDRLAEVTRELFGFS